MARRIKAVAFDTIETLFDIESLRDWLQRIGLPPNLLHPWYSQFLRDGVILSHMGVYRPLKEVAIAALRELGGDHGYTVTPEQAETVMEGFKVMPAHADVRPAFETLNAAGVAVGLLSNGNKSNSQALLEKAQLSHLVQHIMSIDDVQLWKPAAEVYRHAAAVFGMAPANVALVASHAWDCCGAQRAGLASGWRPRRTGEYNAAMGSPDVVGNTLLEVVEKLLK